MQSFSSWPFHSGELASLIRNFDWMKTPLGAIDMWPPHLKSAVDLILQSSVPMVTLWGEKGIMIYNDAYSEFAGGRHPKLLGMPVLEGWTEVADFNSNIMQVCYRDGGTLNYRDKFLILHRPGRPLEVWTDLYYNPIYGPKGKPEGVLAVVIEGTERVIAEKMRQTAESALLKSEQRWRNLAEAMPQLVWTESKSEGREGYLSAQWETYTGIPLRNLLNFGWLTVVHPDDRDRVTSAWKAAFEGETDYDVDFRIRRRDGVYRWFKARGVLVRDSAGKLLTWYGTCTDIQEITEVREQAEMANVAKSEFLANMSHEIRTPMNVVIGLTNLLGMSNPLSPKQREFIRTLQLSADSLLTLINDLLDISKIEARTVDLEAIPFSLVQIIHETISMMAVRVKEKGLSFTSDSRSVENRIYVGDPVRIKQIITNLCANAVKFTESGGVRISIDCHDMENSEVENIVITVRDTGIGIDKEKLPLIFDKFAQADSSINRKYGGTGLGLAITKALVEIMGGQISVDSEPGRGSVFMATLPRKVGENATTNPKESGTTQLSGAGEGQKLVLLVEDYMPNIIVAGAFLDQFGYSYETAQNGAEAINKIQSKPYDIVLMDIQMHGMNGLEATQLIRDREKTLQIKRLPIIGMTAHALSGDRERCLSVGMDDYISKPFEPTELLQKLKNATGRESAQVSRGR